MKSFLMMAISLVCLQAKGQGTMKRFDRYSEYEPNYFLSNLGGDDYGQAKFKLSFKYDLGFRTEKNKVFFAYTQYAFWDVYAKSAPMRELDFTPMLFYKHSFHPDDEETDKLSLTYIKLGYLHQSNGRSDELNRSIFKAFIHSSFRIDFHTKTKGFQLKKIILYPQVWAWNMLADQNKDIARYQGYGQLISSFYFDYGKKEPDIYPLEYSCIIVPAAKGWSIVNNLSFNPFKKIPSTQWIPNLYFQHWDGYGETLVNYDNRTLNYKRQHIFRMGVQFRTR